MSDDVLKENDHAASRDGAGSPDLLGLVGPREADDAIDAAAIAETDVTSRYGADPPWI